MLEYDAWRKHFGLFLLPAAGSVYFYAIRHYSELRNINLQLGRLLLNEREMKLSERCKIFFDI